jgi:hypothetical protein
VSIFEGSSLSLTGSCFMNNNFVGEGLIQVDNEDDLVAVSNNFATEDDGIGCQFIAVLSPDETYSCIEADAQACMAPTPGTTPAPGTPPTPGTTPTPTPGTTPTPVTAPSGASLMSMWTLTLLSMSMVLCLFRDP